MTTYTDEFGQREIPDDWPKNLPPPGPDVWGEGPGIAIGLGIGTGALWLVRSIEVVIRRVLRLPPRTLPRSPRTPR